MTPKKKIDPCGSERDFISPDRSFANAPLLRVCPRARLRCVSSQKQNKTESTCKVPSRPSRKNFWRLSHSPRYTPQVWMYQSPVSKRAGVCGSSASSGRNPSSSTGMAKRRRHDCSVFGSASASYRELYQQCPPTVIMTERPIAVIRTARDDGDDVNVNRVCWQLRQMHTQGTQWITILMMRYFPFH